MEGFYSFWQVVLVHEPLPTTILKILTWHADIFQKALIGIGVFAIGPCRPDEAWYRVDDLTKLVFAFPHGPLRLSSIIVMNGSRILYSSSRCRKKAQTWLCAPIVQPGRCTGTEFLETPHWKALRS